MDVYIGIDPGAKGAICTLVPHSESVPSVGFIDLNKSPKEIYTALDNVMHGNNIVSAYIEDVHSLYGMSAKSNFSFGRNVGVPHTIFAILGIELTTVTPKIWQKAVGVTSTRKDGKNAIKLNVAELAQDLVPHAELHTPRGRLLDGRSDALMIAQYATLLEEGIK